VWEREVEGSCQRNHRTHTHTKNSLTLIVSVVFDDDNIMMTTCHFLFKWRDMFDRTHTQDDAESLSFSPRNGRKSSFGRKSFALEERWVCVAFQQTPSSLDAIANYALQSVAMPGRCIITTTTSTSTKTSFAVPRGQSVSNHPHVNLYPTRSIGIMSTAAAAVAMSYQSIFHMKFSIKRLKNGLPHFLS